MVNNLEAGDGCDDEADEDHNEDTGDKQPDPDWKLRPCFLKIRFYSNSALLPTYRSLQQKHCFCFV